MLKIFCSVPTPGMAKAAEKLNISTTEVCNLYSLWQSKNNKPGVTPTINQLRGLIDNNKEELEAYKYAVPVYRIGNNIENAHQSTVEVNDNNEFILHQIPDNISLNEVLGTWNAIPNSLKSVISDKKDLYTVELWQKMLINSGDVEYNVQDNPNAGLNAMIASLNKLKEYKEENPVSNTKEKPYKEVGSFESGQLASTHKTNGEIEISIKKYIGVDEFMNYFQGNEESLTSEQKKLVLKELEKKGITLDMIKKNLNTPDKVKQFIYLHELSHKMNFESDMKNYDRSNMNAKVNVDIETRATLYAWEQMFGLPESENSITSIGWARTSENGYEVSTRGDKRFSALVATFNKGTIIDGVDVGGRTIEYVYQFVIKKSRKGQAPAKDSKLYNESLKTKEEREDFSYTEGYLPLWQEWARQNPQLMDELRIKAQGKTLTDQFANTRVSQARALSDILNENISSNIDTQEPNEVPEIGTPAYDINSLNIDKESPRAILAREMTPQEIMNREMMIARDFSTVIDEELEDMLDGLQSKMEGASNLEKLQYSNDINELRDPLKGRRRVINELGMDGIIDRIKERYQNWIDLEDSDINDIFGEDVAGHIKDSYQKVLDNFDILFDEASVIVEGNEKLRISRDSKAEVQNTESQDMEEEENNEDAEDGSRVHGNEGYTFKIRFVDPHDSARAETRRALSDIVKVDSEGNPLVDDLGNTVYLREDFVHSTLLSVLSKTVSDPDDFSIRNSDGSYSFPALESMMESYPWVSQIINKLEYDPKLISIFYTDFRKEFISYWMQRGDSIFPINSPVAYDSTMKTISSNYEQGNIQDDDSIFDVNLNIQQRSIDKGIKLADTVLGKLQKVYEDDMEDVASEVMKILNMLGFSSHNVDRTALANIDNLSLIRSILENAKEAFNLASKAEEGQHYVDAAKSPISNIARLIGKVTELDAQTTFRQNGKTYPSYAAPNYIERTFKKFKNDNKRTRFIEEEFKRYDWFFHNGRWSNGWLDLIESNQNVRDMLELKNVFNLNDIDYSDWDSSTITNSFLREYFAIQEDPDQKDQFAWFNFPIFSDTQMATFIKFKKFTGDFKRQLLPLYRNLVKQELRRIDLVEKRRKKGIPAISNFDSRGLKFCFIPELNTLRLSYNGQSLPLIDIIRDYQRKKDMLGIDTYIDRAITAVLDEKRREFFIRHSDILEDESLINFIKTNARVSTEQGVEGKIEEYIWNQMYATSQIIQLMTTDLAYYKDSTDFQKRFKEVYAAGTRLNTNSPYGKKIERTVYISDTIVTSPTYIPLKELLKNNLSEGNISKMDYDSILNKFKGINATDGQAYRSLDSYRSIMDMLGMWTEEMENAFDRISHNEWNMADFNVVWQTIKPFVYGQLPTPDGLGSLMKIPHQNKNSEFLLLATYQVLSTLLNNSPQLRGLTQFMKDNNIDVVQFESAVKAGCGGVININISPSKISKIAEQGYIKVGSLQYEVPNIKDKGISDAFKTIKNHFDSLLDNNKITQEEYNNVIKELRPSEQEVYDILKNSTRAKINDSDVLDNEGYNLTTVHNIDYNDYMIAQPTPEHLFDVESVFGSQYRNLISADLPEDIEVEIDGKKLKGREEVQKTYFSLIIENLLDSYKELNNDFSSIENLQKRLLSIIKGNPKYGRDMLNALEIVEYNGRKTFNIPLSDSTVTSRFQELMTSMFKNSITKQYINGAACILVSDFGFTEELKVIRNEDGSVEAIECYLPAYSKKMYEPFLKETRNGYEIDYNKLKDADPSLLDFIGYRIPTEGKYSILPLRIKGFLPQQNGSSIMLPAEVTTLSGSDFDVDKLFMMLPSFEQKDSKFTRIKYDGTKEPKDNNKKQRDNALIQIGLGILRNKEVGVDLQNPGNFDILKHQARVNDIISNPEYLHSYIQMHKELSSYEETVNAILNDSLDNLNDFLKAVKREDNPLSLDTFIKYHNQNMTGGVLIGIYANNTTMQAKFQGKSLKLKDGFEFTVDDKEIKNLTDVYTEEKVSGKIIRKKISKNCAQFSAASVDNVKDPVLASLMQTKDTANIACFMLRAGMSIPQIGALFNIPQVKSCIGVTSSVKPLKTWITNAEEDIAELRGIDHYTVKPKTSINTLELMALTARFNDKSYMNSLTDEAKADLIEQTIAYTKTFQYIAGLADALGDTVQAYRADSPNGALKRSVALAKRQTMAIDRLLNMAQLEKYPLSGIERVISNDFITPEMSIDEMREKLVGSDMPMLQAFYSLGIDFGMKKLSEYFIQASPYVNNLIDRIQFNSSVPLGEKTLENLYTGVMQFALSNTELFGREGEMSMEEKYAYYHNEFPKEFNKIVHNNPDIAALPFIQKLRANSEGISMKDSARNTPYLREVLMASADNLLYMDNPEAQKLAIGLFRYAYYMEQFKFGPNSFSNHFSTIFKSSFPEYVDTLRDLDSTIGIDDRWNRFITQFYANNPTLAPIVNVADNNYTDDSHTQLVIPTSSVYNPNSISPQPLEFIRDFEDNLYELNKSTAGNEQVTYNKVKEITGNVYNINKDSNDIADALNKLVKEVKEEKGNYVPPIGETPNSNPTVEDFMEQFDSNAFDALIADYENAQTVSEEKYSAKEGLKNENLNPCNVQIREL